MRKHNLLTCILIFLLLNSISCKRNNEELEESEKAKSIDDKTPERQENHGVLEDDVHFLTPYGISVISSEAELQNGTYKIQYTDINSIPNVQVNEKIVANENGGFFARVNSLSRSGNIVTYETDSAFLGELFKTLHVNNVQSASELNPKIIYTDQSIDTVNRSNYEWNFGNRSLYSGPEGSFNLTNANLSFAPNFIMEITEDDGDIITSARMGFSGYFDYAFNLTANFHSPINPNLASFDYVILEYPSYIPVVLPGGAIINIPVEYKSSITLQPSLVNFEGVTSVTNSKKHNLDFFILYDQITGFDFSSVHSPLNIVSEMTNSVNSTGNQNSLANIQIGLQYTVEIYGRVGPYIYPNFFGRVSHQKDSYKNSLEKMDIGWGVDFGVDFDASKFVDISIWNSTLYENIVYSFQKPKKIEIISGNNQFVNLLTQADSVLKVKLLDYKNQPYPNSNVVWEIIPNNTSVNSPMTLFSNNSLTNNNGIASMNFDMGTRLIEKVKAKIIEPFTNNLIDEVEFTINGIQTPLDLALSETYIQQQLPPVNGSIYTFQYEVNNLSSSNLTTSFNLRAYINNGTIPCDINNTNYGSYIGSTIVNSGINALNSANGIIQCNIPPLYQFSGNDKLVLVIDQYNSLGEQNRTNNISCFDIIQTQPNFTLNPTVTFSPTPVIEGQTMTVYYSIINNGDDDGGFESTKFEIKSATGNTLGYTFYDSDNSLTISANGGILNRSVNYNLPNLPGGQYQLHIEADGLNIIDESDETDNKLVVNFIIQDNKPDLKFSSTLTVSPNSIVIGNQTQVSGTIENTGTSNASNFNIKFYLSNDNTVDFSDDYLGLYSITSLSAGGNNSFLKYITIPSNATIGGKYILAVIDESNIIQELNETNNQIARYIDIIPARPDLTVNSVSLSTSSVIKGDQITISATMENIGQGNAGNTQMAFYLSENNQIGRTTDHYLGSKPILNFDAGDIRTTTGTFTIPSTWQSGTSYIFAYVDHLDQISEEIESTNNYNVGGKPLTVIGQFKNLKVNTWSVSTSNFSVSSATSSPTISITVENNGNISIGNSTKIRAYLSTNTTLDASDIEVGSTTLINLGAGGSASRTITLSGINQGTSTGSYYLIIKLDADNEIINESSTVDNVRYTSFSVSP